MKPVLVKKALPRHWSKDFDTTEDLRNALRQARLMSLEDAKNIENIPLRPEIRDWELEQTAEGMKSIIPGIQGGKITDQGYVDEGGAFTYPAQLQSFLPLIHPEARMSGVTMPDIPGSMGKPSGRPSVLVGSFEKPEFHATQKEGRVQTEGFMPGGFDPSQAVLLTEPSRAFARQEVPMAIHNLVGGKMKDYAPGTFGYNEPVGRAMESFNILPHSTENPLSQYSGWGKPRTVDDEFRLSEPMDIAMRLLKEARPYALIPNFDLRHMLNPKSDIQESYTRLYVPHALSNAESATEVYNQLMQEAKIREEETDYFPLPQTQIEDYGEQHPPIFRYNATNAVRYRPHFQDIHTGEPMDLAWRLLKMPIVSDSPEVRQLHNADGEPVGPTHIHQFQDPVTGEVKPLYISPASNPDSENLYAGIVGNNGDRASAKFNTGDGDYASLDGIETQEPFQRRGYMSAIYDAVEEYLQQHKKGRNLVPSDFQSDEGKAFWESRNKEGM